MLSLNKGPVLTPCSGSPCCHLPRRVLGSPPSWVKDLAQALLQVEDVNVVVVDWIYSASFAYNLVVQSYKEVAVQISVLLSQLQVGGSSRVNLLLPFRIKFKFWRS